MLYDALIVGSGPAGLSVALGLSRVHRRAAIFTKPDGKGFRNEGAHEMHNVISRDGEDPVEFRRKAVKQIKRYGTVDFIEAEIISMDLKERLESNESEYFEVRSAGGGVWSGKKMALAMGSVEVFPNIEGYKENWPQNIFQCLFCDGHERSHLPGGILTFPNPMYGHMAQMMNLIVTDSSGPPTVFTDGPVSTESAPMQQAMKQLEALACKIETGKIVKLIAATPPDVGVTVVLDNGKECKLGYLGHKPWTELAGEEMIKKLGIEVDEMPMMGRHIKTTDQFGSTAVRGVFVAGDAGSPLKAVSNAIGSGATVAAGMVQQLIAEDMEQRFSAQKAVMT